MGHLKKYCYLWKKQQNLKSHEAHQAKDTEFKEEPEVLNITEDTESGKWILDSGCSFHMCPHKGWFTDLVEVSQGSVPNVDF